MATGDRYQINLIQRWGDATGQILENVFAYEQTNGTGGAFELIDAFSENIVTAINVIQHNIVVNSLCTVVNLDDPADFEQEVLDGSGAVSDGDVLPPYASWTYRYLRSTRAVRDGRKAFAGIAEGWQVAGNANAGVLSTLNSLSLILENTLTEAVSGSTWEPRIWRRPGTYSSGVVSAPGLFYAIDGVQYSAISTQSSRKYNRGV